MRRGPLFTLIAVVVTIVVAGVIGLIVTGDDDRVTITMASPTPVPADTEVDGTPEETARLYLSDWEDGDYESMRQFVDEPPADFVAQHKAFDDATLDTPVKFSYGDVDRIGEEKADLAFTAERKLTGYGTWKTASVLHMEVRDLVWKVLWTPATILADLAPGGQVNRVSLPPHAARLVTRQGMDFPQDNDAEPYIAGLTTKLPRPATGTDVGWALELANPGQPAQRILAAEGTQRATDVRTTFDYFVQAAAARALDAVSQPAAVVVVQPSTGDVLAVADRLGARGAFERKVAPGSTFKTITAAALIQGGLGLDTQVGCPAAYTIPNGRTIDNFQGADHGTVTFREAYALSCNTSFAALAVQRLTGDALTAAAKSFGFNATMPLGTCGTITPPENNDRLAEDSFGQGTVEATPLCMALMAGAVASGTWRAPHFMPDDGGSAGATLAPGVADGLRALMSQVTVDGTASGAGLPAGTSGKTGTAEDWQGGEDHAWFVGYRDDLAFSVFVEHGGTGRDTAVPIAARFLKAL